MCGPFSAAEVFVLLLLVLYMFDPRQLLVAGEPTLATVVASHSGSDLHWQATLVASHGGGEPRWWQSTVVMPWSLYRARRRVLPPLA